MSTRHWLVVASGLLIITLAGCPSATVPVKHDNNDLVQQPDGGASDAGDVDAGGADAGSLDGGTGDSTSPDAGVADGGTHVVAAGGTDEVDTPEEKSAREVRVREEAEKKAAADKAAADEVKLKTEKTTLEGEMKDAFNFIREGDDAKAMASYAATLTQHPEAYVAHYNLGVVHERMGEKDKAVNEYREALKLKPDFEPASDNLTRLFVRSGQAKTAELDLLQRIGQYKDNMGLRNQLVRVLLAEGRDADAETYSKKVLKRDEHNIDAMLNLAEIWYGQQKYELARMVLDNARKVDETVPAVWNMLAFVYLALDQRPLALDAFRKAADLRPDFPEAHNNLGAMLNESNDCDGATQELTLAVRYAPTSAQAHLNLGNAFRCSRKYLEAEKEYLKAIELDPKATDPLFNLAVLYLDGDMKPKWDEASPADSEKLARLQKAVDYFQKYKDAGGSDARSIRYAEETTTAIQKEKDRLERVAKNAAREKDREAKKKAAEDAVRVAREQQQAAINQAKVAGKSDVEDDPPIAVAPAPQPVVVPMPVVTPKPVVVPASTVRPPKVEAAAPAHLHKLMPKEDEPDSGP
jgi:Tfp pilus assembly protein PilF